MAIATIQIFGVFIASLFGLNCIVRGMRNNTNVQAFQVYAFAVGMAMATCGIFL